MARRSKSLLLMTLGCALLFALVVFAAYVFGPTKSLDEAGFNGFVEINARWVHELSWRLSDFGDPPQVALITLVLAAGCLVRGRPRSAVAVVGLIAATSVSSEVLKAILSHPRYPSAIHYTLGPEALPSGHATAAMSLALAGVLAAPRKARFAAAVIGAVLALGVGASVIVIQWHFPSDVIAGYLLATGWALAILAALYEAEARYPAGQRWASTAFARATDKIATGGLDLAAVGVVRASVVGGGVLLLGDPSRVADYACQNTQFVVAAGAIASAALVLPVAAAAASRRS
jgi:membrane-associated phospholipid phosphatase